MDYKDQNINSSLVRSKLVILVIPHASTLCLQAYILTNTKWNENIFASNSAKISSQITVNREGF